MKLGAAVGATYASTAARKLFATAERRVELDRERELRTADAVAERLGHMKGALMKLGQMVTINQPLDQDTAMIVVEEMGRASCRERVLLGV